MPTDAPPWKIGGKTRAGGSAPEPPGPPPLAGGSPVAITTRPGGDVGRARPEGVREPKCEDKRKMGRGLNAAPPRLLPRRLRGGALLFALQEVQLVVVRAQIAAHVLPSRGRNFLRADHGGHAARMVVAISRFSGKVMHQQRGAQPWRGVANATWLRTSATWA